MRERKAYDQVYFASYLIFLVSFTLISLNFHLMVLTMMMIVVVVTITVWKVVSGEIRTSKLRVQSNINYINNFRRLL